MAVAGLGEITGALGGGVSKHAGEMLSVFLTAMDDSALDVSSNAIYGLGLLLESTPQNLSKYHLTASQLTGSQYNPILNKLQRFFPDTAPQNAKDNAVGCVSRMILRHPQAVPLDVVCNSHTTPLMAGSPRNNTLSPIERRSRERSNVSNDNSAISCEQSHHASTDGTSPSSFVESIGGRQTSQDVYESVFIGVGQSVTGTIPSFVSVVSRINGRVGLFKMVISLA
jgi:hypothetical protein